MEHSTSFRTIQIDCLSILCREAGPKDATPTPRLHGLPSSSRMFDPVFTGSSLWAPRPLTRQGQRQSIIN